MTQKLKCNGINWIMIDGKPNPDPKGCQRIVEYIDNKGFIYCEKHGIFRESYCPCRKFTAKELVKLESGKPIRY